MGRFADGRHGVRMILAAQVEGGSHIAISLQQVQELILLVLNKEKMSIIDLSERIQYSYHDVEQKKSNACFHSVWVLNDGLS